MELRPLSPALAVTGQIRATDLPAIAAAGFKSIVCNRPDGEGNDQPGFQEIEQAAQALGLPARHLPAESGRVTPEQGRAFGALMAELPQPVLAYCRSGMRSATLWTLSCETTTQLEAADTAQTAGFDVKGALRQTPAQTVAASHQVVIVGGGSAGIATAASLLSRQPDLDVAIIDPAETHYYQPGWTLVGGGVFQAPTTARPMAAVLPRGVHWIKAAVAAFEPERNTVLLEGCRAIRYEQLIVCPGIKLDWAAIDGLTETLGKNGVTSNYRYDLAPYTWRLVEEFRGGRALFTQPPMPIKCAGAPQKAMYLSADQWRRQGVLDRTDIQFCSAGAVLFGVADYVPALMSYVKSYGIGLNFGQTLTAVDGPARQASFQVALPEGGSRTEVREFDLLHAVPPQRAPDFIRNSPLADAAGWIEVDQRTLRHVRHANVYGLGDAGSMPNAKTAAAARKQAPVVAHNVLADRGLAQGQATYDGYGSCPLTVERGKIVLAEFTYGGKVAPSLPTWLIDGTQPSRLAWYLKERVLPPLYWEAMLKGREWLAEPEMVG